MADETFRLDVLDKVTECALIHRGGEADVYAISTGTENFVLKWYGRGARFDGTVIDKLERLADPGVYRIRESGVREGVPYLVYDFLQGTSSAEVGPMPVAVALDLLRELGRTLSRLDREGIHHGDLSPSNVMLCASGRDLRPVLVDCGIVGPGTPAYAAPERFLGNVASAKSDLYGLGMLLFRWVSGRDLVMADDYEGYVSGSASIDEVDVSGALYAADCCSVQELSALAPLWKALLRKDPDDRAEDFDELDELLEIALASAGVGEVDLRVARQKFAKILFDEKSERKFPRCAPDGEKGAFPYRKRVGRPRKNKRRWIVFGTFVLILVLVALWVYTETQSPDIDATGSLLLQKSRNLESSAEPPDSEKVPADRSPSDLLLDLPTPAADGLQ